MTRMWGAGPPKTRSGSAVGIESILYGYVLDDPVNLIDPFGLYTDEELERLVENDIHDVKAILFLEDKCGTMWTLNYLSFGGARDTYVRLKDGRIADLQYTIDIAWANTYFPVIGPSAGTYFWEILRQLPIPSIHGSRGLAAKEHRRGIYEGLKFYPFSQTKIKDILSDEYFD